MKKLFEELAYETTPIGVLSLRRRYEPRVGNDVFEIKLDEEFLMSSLMAESEIALADLGLSAASGSAPLDVAVGGLGLCYTARAVLNDHRTKKLLVIDYLQTVIDWHESGVLPLGPELTGDSRCTLRQGDFFALAASANGLDATAPQRRFDAVLVDIDHSPEALLDSRSSSFYSVAGYTGLARWLKPGGIFGLWSDDAPDDQITGRMGEAFASAWTEPVVIKPTWRDTAYTQTIYLARKAG